MFASHMCVLEAENEGTCPVKLYFCPSICIPPSAPTPHFLFGVHPSLVPVSFGLWRCRAQCSHQLSLWSLLVTQLTPRHPNVVVFNYLITLWASPMQCTNPDSTACSGGFIWAVLWETPRPTRFSVLGDSINSTAWAKLHTAKWLEYMNRHMA